MKKFIHKIVKAFKSKNNLMLLLISVLTLVISFFMVGASKTLALLFIVVIMVLLIKYSSALIPGLKRRKKNNSHESTNDEHHHKLKKKKFVRVLSKFVLIGGIVVILGVALFMAYIVIKAPKFDPQNLYRKEATVIYDSDGNVITKIGRELREKISYDDMPQVFVDAIVATEDSRFFQHNGFDLPRFLKASLGQALGRSGAGGGSTITMQVAKNNFTSTKQSVLRKFTDIYLSIFQIEKHYTKKQILEFYVNAPYLGNNSYGVAEAAQNYFGKNIKDLNLSEAALLAGLFQAPGSYDPTLHPDYAAKRRSTVLYLMRRHGYINADEEKAANAIPIASLINKGKNGITNSVYQGYIDVAIDEVIKETGNDPYNVPMKIYTNMIRSKQDYLNKVLSGELFKWENDQVQAGVAVCDVQTGAIVAIGNGRNRTDSRIFNFATMIKRQIGSTAKPLFDYGPAMEFNNWSTYSPVLDDSYTYSDGKSIMDWDGKYNGLLTSRLALSQSRNIPALKVFQQISNKNIVKFVESLGITPEENNGYIHEAHSIGAFNGTSPLQLAAAYSAFANGGYYSKPHAVSKVEYIDSGKITTFESPKTKVMSDSTAFMITDILKSGVDSGAISGGKVSGVEVAAKSGTSNFDDATLNKFNLPSSAINDLWYSGFSPDYAVAMWYGYEKISSTNYSRFGYSSGYRDRLYTTIVKGIYDKNNKAFTAPSSVVQVNVEKDTIPAMLPSQYTPSNMITAEYFKKGTEPTDISPRFNTLPTPTGLSGKTSGSSIILSWDNTVLTDTVTDDYLKVIKGHEDKYLAIRKDYDNSVLGTLGYNVYTKDGGNLTLLGFTTDNNYTYMPSSSSNITFVVKTAYSIFKSNMSNGAEFSLSNSNVSVVDANLSGSSSVSITHTTGTYSDPGVVVTDNGAVVSSNNYTVQKTITKASDNSKPSSIDLSVIDTYTILYTITYGSYSQSLTRTVKVT